MDFFEAQDRARKRTKFLVLLFSLAVLGTVIAGYAATMLILHYGAEDQYAYAQPVRIWDPRVFGLVSLVTVAVVGCASLFKWSQMRTGGSAVAEMLSGRRIDPQTTDLRERRLLNVVEEMAIASGVPVPAVYVLDNEPGLNAFAAGLTTSDAVVAVTRGTLEKLNRDELQGVVAHEFSHILNGDMRMNVKLTAIIFGILVIGLIGRGILGSLGRTRVRRSSGKKGGGGIALVIALGLAMLLIGHVGYFADASAVQFTRNPLGVSGALKKIGGYALGGTVIDRHAGEIGHFFFAQAFRSNLGGLWATHPPLAQRIKAIEPAWDGQLFEPEQVVDVATESFATAGFGGVRHSPNETLARVHAATATVPPPARVVEEIGSLTAAHFRRAQSLLANLPDRLRTAAHDPAQAPALVFALLFGAGQEQRAAAAGLVEKLAGPAAAEQATQLRAAVSILDPAARLPLLQLALPTIRSLDAAALERFVGTLD
jgi:Zn-dependent protease with chaperone function